MRSLMASKIGPAAVRRKWKGAAGAAVAAVAFASTGCDGISAPVAHGGSCRTTAWVGDGGAIEAAGADSVRSSAADVRWRIAGDSRDELDAWCAGVGPAVVGSFASAGAAADTAVLDSLLIVTWNVHVGGGDVVGMITRLRAGQLTGGAPVEHFALLLQETFQANAAVPGRVAGARSASHIEAVPPAGAARRPVDEVARELGLSFVYVPSMRNGEAPGAEGGRAPHEDRGNAIVSTLPLMSPWALELPVERQRRVAVVADVQGRTGRGLPWQLQLASVHLEPQTRWNPLGITPRVRQAEWLLSALPPAERAIVGGDFNSRFGAEDEPAVRRVRAEYPEPAAVPSFRTYDGPLMTGQVDFIFARGVEVSGYDRVDDAFGSDHWPVLAWVRF